MTLTEDELARLAELEDLLTVGLVEQPINGSVLSWGEAALIAHRIGRHLLRASPVADTAGIDAAWREAEAAMAATEGPDYADVGWEVGIRSLRWDGSGTYVARAEQHTFLDGNVLTIIESEPQVGPAAALLALAAALRTPKPEGDR